MINEHDHRRGFLGKILIVGASVPILTTLKLPSGRDIKEFGSPKITLEESANGVLRFYDIDCTSCFTELKKCDFSGMWHLEGCSSDKISFYRSLSAQGGSISLK